MTTVLMKNLPNPFTRDDLIELLDTHGFAATYDLVYVPVSYVESSSRAIPR